MKTPCRRGPGSATLFACQGLLAALLQGCPDPGTHNAPPIPQSTTQPNPLLQAPGCFLGASPVGSPGVQILPTSGSYVLDQNLNSLGNWCVSIYSVFPDFKLINDGGMPNAYATKHAINPRLPDGTVFFGSTLLLQEYQNAMSLQRQTYSVVAILAHEFGHIFQYKQGMALPGPVLELGADFLAGWALSHQPTGSVNVSDAMQAFYSRGDYNFNNPQHHGTPKQRLDSFLKGLQASSESTASAYQMGIDLATKQLSTPN